MMCKQTGFTLIELMIVVSIVGILSAIAVGYYNVYTKRAHASEGILISENARLAVFTYYSTHSALPANNAEAGLGDPESFTGNSVSKVEIDSGNVIITFNEKVISGDTIVFEIITGGGSIGWDCTGGTLLNDYRPINCR